MEKMKKFSVVAILVAMVLLVAFPIFSNGLSAKEKAVVPSPRDGGGVQVFDGVEKIKSESGFFEIKLLAPVDTSVSERVEFEWDVYQIQSLPGEPVIYIFLNGRKFAILRGLAKSFTANLQPGEYRWQVLIGVAWNGGSHLDTSVVANFEVKSESDPFMQNYPNPFNPTTTISFQFPEATHVTLKVYNSLGQEVAALVDGIIGVGDHTVVWNAQNVPSGIYFARLQTDNFSKIIRMQLIR